MASSISAGLLYPTVTQSTPALRKANRIAFCRSSRPNVPSPASFIENVAGCHWERILKIDCRDGAEFACSAPGRVDRIELCDVSSNSRLSLQPRHLVFTAGAGNSELRRRAGLQVESMQRRPLHMAMVRGNLPELNGHCVDGAKTRVTITSERLADGKVVWQLGGQIAEDGVVMDSRTLIAHAAAELAAVLPGVDLHNTEWATYRVERAEGATAGGKRPDDVQITREGNVLTCWPTKLALAPELARAIATHVDPSDESVLFPGEAIRAWPRPAVAASPWETAMWLRPARPVAAYPQAAQ